MANRSKYMRTILESMNITEESSCGCGGDCKCGGSCGGQCGDENCPCECNTVDEAIESSIMEDENSDNAVYRMEEIAEEIQKLAREALDLVQYNGGDYNNAYSYWYGHIMAYAGSEEYGDHSRTILDSMREIQHAGADYEKAAQEMVEYMEDDPDTNPMEIASQIARKYGISVNDLDEYMNEEGYSR